MTSKISINNLSVDYGEKRAVNEVSMEIPERSVTAIIGPSGCGKSTLIRCLNRMNDFIPECKVTGEIGINGDDILDQSMDLVELRRNIGMVFQKPNPFPFSIYDNVAYGPKMAGLRKRHLLDCIVVNALRKSALYGELKERMADNANDLSGGQQQRLCIARALAMEPEVLLMDEPCSALDPIATAKIEELIKVLSDEYTVVIVTHNMEQAKRVSDRTAFLYMGDLVEYGETARLFDDPEDERTRDYIGGRMG